jgi:hypothetical protein
VLDPEFMFSAAPHFASTLARCDTGGLSKLSTRPSGHRPKFSLKFTARSFTPQLPCYLLQFRSVADREESIPQSTNGDGGSQAMRRLLLIIILTAVVAEAQTPPQAAPQAPATLPKELSLSQALDIALTNNTTIREAQANFEQLVGQTQRSRSVLLPQLTFDAHQALMTVNLQGIGIDAPNAHGVQGPFGSMDARLNLTLDILNIAGRQSWKSYSSRQESSRFQIGNAREAVTLNVVGAYLQALRLKATRDTLIEQTRLANDLYRLTADRANQGVASQLDANRAKQQVNALEQQRLEAEQSYVAAKLEIATLLHTNITDNFEVADPAAYGSEQAMDRDATLKAAPIGASRLSRRRIDDEIRGTRNQVLKSRTDSHIQDHGLGRSKWKFPGAQQQYIQDCRNAQHSNHQQWKHQRTSGRCRGEISRGYREA